LHADDGGADKLAEHDGDDVKTVGGTALVHEEKIRNLFFVSIFPPPSVYDLL
jgi:hypothetical protein